MQHLKRDADQVKRHLKVREDGAVYTTAPCKIMIPTRYKERHLANVGAETHVLGIFAIIVGDYYAVNNTCAMMRINPSSTETVSVDDTSYLEFHFNAGDKVIHSTDLIMNDTLTYYIYDEFIAKGRIPWFINYIDLAKLFDTAEEHAGVNLGNRAVIDLIISTIARQPDDLTKLYRHGLTKIEDVYTNPPAIVPFRSVIWNTADTTSKLIGAHFGDSVTSALVNPSESVERIEELLRE